MESSLHVSDEIKKSVEQYLQQDPGAMKIAVIEQKIDNSKMDIIHLEAELSILQKTRPQINIEQRKSIMWCLEIDADNPFYFLKSKEGLVKCVEFKHKIKLTPKQNNSFGATLSIMFRDGLVGRIEHQGVYFYGLPKFFDKDAKETFTILKKKHEKNLSSLRQVNV